MKLQGLTKWLQCKLSIADDTAGGAEVELPRLSAVRAKMRVNAIETTQYGPGDQFKYKRVKLGCIYGTEGENADYSKATPSGECWMQIDQGVPAADWFEPGQDYYVTFTPVPKK